MLVLYHSPCVSHLLMIDELNRSVKEETGRKENCILTGGFNIT